MDETIIDTPTLGRVNLLVKAIEVIFYTYELKNWALINRCILVSYKTFLLYLFFCKWCRLRILRSIERPTKHAVDAEDNQLEKLSSDRDEFLSRQHLLSNLNGQEVSSCPEACGSLPYGKNSDRNYVNFVVLSTGYFGSEMLSPKNKTHCLIWVFTVW